jgi:prepilin-type N-terminal cleavage/methylation domain-containing protein
MKRASARPHAGHPGSAKAFSLTELLAVLAIMSILLVATVPLFANSSNSARQASREIIKVHLNQARAHAISTNTSTAVVIPVIDSVDSHAARAITLLEVEDNGGSYVPLLDQEGGQRMIQRWEILPGNFYFLSAAQASSQRPTIMDESETVQTEFKGLSLVCHMIVFGPNGQIVRPSAELNVAIAQAKRSNNSLTLTEKSGSKAVVDFMNVNRLTAKTRMSQP